MKKMPNKKTKLIGVKLPYIKQIFKLREGSSDIEVFLQIFIEKEYTLPINLKPRLIIDGGANIGLASIWFANRFPEAKIIAIEPEDSNFNLLKKNTAKYPNIKLIKAGIWNKNTTLRIKKSIFKWSGNWDFQVEEVNSKIEKPIRSVTINEILKNSKFKNIDILKLDIEGAEKEIFSNNNYKGWLKKVNLLIVELHDCYKKGCSNAFYSAIKKYKFNKIKKGEKVILIKNNN